MTRASRSGDEPAADASAPRPSAKRTGQDPALTWHLCWALAALAAACILVVAVGKASMLAMLAMLIIGLPGLIGALWRPAGREKAGFLVLWALAAAMAATLEGGLGGPLAVWCVLPAVVTIVLEAPWALGVGLSMAALLVVAAINALHLAWRLPTHPLNFWLVFVAVLTTAGGAVGGLAAARLRAKRDKAEVEAELQSFQTLMGDLPELAFAMDAAGRATAVFGRPLAGVDIQRLHDGFVETAEEMERPKLRAALAEATAEGHATVTFTPDQPGALKLTATIQRTTHGGLTAILRQAPPQPVRLPPSAPIVVPVPVAAPAPEPAVINGAGPAMEVLRKLDEARAALKVSEAARQKAEADAAGRALFLANMSHELRTPLNAIMGFSDIMRAKMFGDLQPKYAEYAELIHESGGHLMDLINDVLDMSKIEAQRFELHREVFDVRDAVNGALRLMRLQADDAGVRLRGVLPAAALEVNADRRAIKQIVLNLVSNALKFTPSGGLITVTADKAGTDFELTVADSGVGIAPEDLDRLGRPYEQAGGPNDRAQGTGLGLSLVRSFAELHGGRMNIESRLGEGTAVAVRLPVLAAPLAPVAAPAPIEPAPAPVLEAQPVKAERPWPKVPPGGAPEA